MTDVDFNKEQNVYYAVAENNGYSKSIINKLIYKKKETNLY